MVWPLPPTFKADRLGNGGCQREVAGARQAAKARRGIRWRRPRRRRSWITVLFCRASGLVSLKLPAVTLVIAGIGIGRAEATRFPR